MNTILVTGGAGFIGSHTVIALIEAGYDAVIVDDLSNSQASVIDALQSLCGRQIPFYQQSFQNIPALHKIIDTHAINGVIHFAAFKAVGESVHEPLRYYDNNVAGFIKFLQLCETIPTLKHIVFSSSCTVYGEPEALPVIEINPFKPASSPYGAAKQMSETILRDSTIVKSSHNSLALRYFNPIGAHSSARIGELPRGTPANLVPFITQTAAGLRTTLTVYGNDYPTPDGTCIRDYIHVTDLAEAHVKALSWLEKQAAGIHDAINIGTGQGNSVLEVITTFEEVTGIKVPYQIGPRRQGDLVNIYASVDKAQSLIDWHAKKSLSSALLDAWHWQQSIK